MLAKKVVAFVRGLDERTLAKIAFGGLAVALDEADEPQLVGYDERDFNIVLCGDVSGCVPSPENVARASMGADHDDAVAEELGDEYYLQDSRAVRAASEWLLDGIDNAVAFGIEGRSIKIEERNIGIEFDQQT